jgi:Zn-dependent protease with chaperone function
MGHWKNNHSTIMIFINIINIFVLFFTFSFVINNHSLLISFGFDHESNFISLILFLKIYDIVAFFINLSITCLVRKMEF